MKKHVTILLISFLALSATFSLGEAAQNGFGFHGGYLKSELMDSGFYVGGQFRSRLSPAFGYEVALSYRDEESSADIEYKGETVKAKTLARSYPLTASLIFTLFAERKVPVNLIGGLGVYFYSLTFRPEGGKESSEFNTEFGYHLGAGVEYPVSLGVRVDADIKYLFLDLENEYGDVVLSDATSNAFMIHFGMTFYF